MKRSSSVKVGLKRPTSRVGLGLGSSVISFVEQQNQAELATTFGHVARVHLLLLVAVHHAGVPQDLVCSQSVEELSEVFSIFCSTLEERFLLSRIHTWSVKYVTRILNLAKQVIPYFNALSEALQRGVYKSLLSVRNCYTGLVNNLIDSRLQDPWLQCFFFGIAQEYTLLLDTLVGSMPKTLLPPLPASMLTGMLRSCVLAVVRKMNGRNQEGFTFGLLSCLKCFSSVVREGRLSSVAVKALESMAVEITAKVSTLDQLSGDYTYLASLRILLIDALALSISLATVAGSKWSVACVDEFKNDAERMASEWGKFYFNRQLPPLLPPKKKQAAGSAKPPVFSEGGQLVEALFVDLVEDLISSGFPMEKRRRILICYPAFMDDELLVQMFQKAGAPSDLMQTLLDNDIQMLSERAAALLSVWWPRLRATSRLVPVLPRSERSAAALPGIIAEMSESDVARALTFIDWSLFRVLSRRELLLVPRVDSKRELAARLAPHWCDLQDRAERVSLWVLSVIMWSERRKKVAEFFLEVCSELFKMRNFFSGGMVLLSLQSPMIQSVGSLSSVPKWRYVVEMHVKRPFKDEVNILIGKILTEFWFLRIPHRFLFCLFLPMISLGLM